MLFCMRTYVCMWEFISRERNGIKPRVYECWTNAMVYYTFCRTFLRLRYSDYLYESLKSVTLDWNARAYTITISKENKASEKEKKGKNSFDKTQNSTTKLYLNLVCIRSLCVLISVLHFACCYLIFLYRVFHCMQKQLKKQKTRYHIHLTRKNPRENSMKIHTAKAETKKLNPVNTN